MPPASRRIKVPCPIHTTWGSVDPLPGSADMGTPDAYRGVASEWCLVGSCADGVSTPLLHRGACITTLPGSAYRGPHDAHRGDAGRWCLVGSTRRVP